MLSAQETRELEKVGIPFDPEEQKVVDEELSRLEMEFMERLKNAVRMKSKNVLIFYNKRGLKYIAFKIFKEKISALGYSSEIDREISCITIDWKEYV